MIRSCKSYKNCRHGYRRASEARMWKPDRTYRNRHRRAYSTPCALRRDIGLLPQWISSSLRGQIRVGKSISKATAVGALELSSSTSLGRKKDNKINIHERSKTKSQPNTSSESLVVEERREQTQKIREKREERKWPQTKFNAFLYCPRRAGL